MSTRADITEYPDDVCEAADKIMSNAAHALIAAGIAPRDVPHALVAGACAISQNNMCQYHYRATLEDIAEHIAELVDEANEDTEDHDRPCGHVH